MIEVKILTRTLDQLISQSIDFGWGKWSSAESYPPWPNQWDSIVPSCTRRSCRLLDPESLDHDGVDRGGGVDLCHVDIPRYRVATSAVRLAY